MSDGSQKNAIGRSKAHSALLPRPFPLGQVLAPLFLGHPLPPEKLEEHTRKLDGVLKLFEEKFLQDRPFIAGRDISLADLVAIVELMQVSCGRGREGATRLPAPFLLACLPAKICNPSFLH